MAIKLKKITADAVVAVFSYLLFRDSEVTTLDVKNELRAMGYKAIQSEISEICMEHFEYISESEATYEVVQDTECVLAYRIEGDHRVYALLYADLFEDDEDDENTTCACGHASCNTPVPIGPESVIDLIKGYLSEGINDIYSISGKLNAEDHRVSPRSVAAYKANITMGRY